MKVNEILTEAAPKQYKNISDAIRGINDALDRKLKHGEDVHGSHITPSGLRELYRKFPSQSEAAQKVGLSGNSLRWTPEQRAAHGNAYAELARIALKDNGYPIDGFEK